MRTGVCRGAETKSLGRRTGLATPSQIAIEQLLDFDGSAWFPNLIQRSQNLVVETTT
jgi:hypothetical protein